MHRFLDLAKNTPVLRFRSNAGIRAEVIMNETSKYYERVERRWRPESHRLRPDKANERAEVTEEENQVLREENAELRRQLKERGPRKHRSGYRWRYTRSRSTNCPAESS